MLTLMLRLRVAHRQLVGLVGLWACGLGWEQLALASLPTARVLSIVHVQDSEEQARREVGCYYTD